MQKTLLQYPGANITHSIQSATTDRMFDVCTIPGHENCQCGFFKIHNRTSYRKPCRHMLEQQLGNAANRIIYLEDRTKSNSKAFFDSFEQCVAMFEFENRPEFEYITCLILSLAYSQGHVTSDDVYDLVGGSFTHDFQDTRWGARVIIEKKAD